MASFQRRPVNVEAFQVSFPVTIRISGESHTTASSGDWVVRNEHGNIEVLSNEDFNVEFVVVNTPVGSVFRSPRINSKVITPEDIDMMREF